MTQLLAELLAALQSSDFQKFHSMLYMFYVVHIPEKSEIHIDYIYSVL